MNDLQKLYDVLKRDGYYTKSFDEFKVQWQDQGYQDKVYGVVSRDGLYTKSKDEFITKYSGSVSEQPTKAQPKLQEQEPLKKKESTELASKSGKPTSVSSTKQDDFYKGGLGEAKSTKKTEPKKQAGMSYEFKTYTGYPGKEKNEYRVSDGNWVRRQPGEKNWVTITNEGSINALNNQFKQDIKPFESKDEVSKVKDYNNLNKQFQQNLSFVNSKLVDKSEEEVIPKLQRLFPAFTFEQSRAGADRVMVTAPNGKKEEFLLDNYTWSSDKAEADRLKGWMSGNYDAKVAKEEAELRRVEKTAEDKVERKVLPGGGSVTTVTPSFVDRDTAFPIIEEQAKKERADYYKAKSEQVKEIYDKYSNSKGGVKDFEATQAFAELKADDAEIKRLNAYQDDIKMDIQDYASKKQKAATYLNEADAKLRRGEITQEQYDLQYKPQIEEMEAELKGQQSRIQSQTDNIDLVKKAAERAAAENYIIQESKGSFGGGLAFSAVKAMTSLPRLALGIMDIDTKDLAEQTAKDLGLFTTREYVQSENRSDLAKVAFSLTESLVAMQSGGSALGGLALYGMGYYELKDELDQVEGMTEQEKMIMAGAYGVVSAALERFGIESAVGKISSSTGKSLKMGIMKEVFSSLTKNASKEVIEAAVINSTKKYLTSAGLNVVGGAVVEGTTEALQSLSSAGIKELYDLGKETDYFNNEGASKVFEDALYEGYLGALGGAIMSGVYNTAQVGVRGLKANSNELKLLMQAAETEGMDSAVLASVKADMLSGKITKEQAKTIVDNFQDVKSKVDQMPDDISTDGKSVALSLMVERDELDKQKAGKDPNLVKPITDRINEINNSLQQIPIDYAIQKQGADAVPVQSRAGVSQQMEEGKPEAKPQVVTGETITEEVEVEGPKAEQPQAEVAQEIVQSEENQGLIDDYVQRQTEFINGATVLNQEEKQELIDKLVSDPIAYAEERAGKSEIFGDAPHTDLLNSLQRQPVAETATTEKLTVNPSEGYSFEYESENDIPAELKGVEPTGRTETKVGKGKNAKTKLKLTFTGQQLVDAGLAVTPEAQAEVQKLPEAQPNQRFEFTPETLPEQLKGVEPEMGVTEVRKRLFGEVKDVKKITMPEYDLMVKQLMDFEKGAKTTLAKVTKASKELTAYVKEMVKKGHITTNQAVSVLRRFSATNLLDENSINNFVNYMRKVFNDAEYANKIANVRKKLPTAKKNIKTKIGVAKDLAPLMERVFAINPSIIPDDVFNKYSDAVMMMGERAAVLNLNEYNEIKENLIDVIDAVEMEAGLAEELVDLFNANKITEEGKVNFSETLNKMFNDGIINEYERSLMKKYRSLFMEKKVKESKKEEKVNAAKEAVASATVNTSDLPTKDERDVAKKISKLLKAKAYEMLTDDEVIQLSKVINNINNGFLTHKAEQLRERMSGLVKAKDLISPIQQVKVMFGELLKGNLKSKVTGENVYTNIIKGNSAAFIDEVFGNFKERPFFNNIYEPIAQAIQRFNDENKIIRDKVDKLENDLLRHFTGNGNDASKSKFKMMTYMLQVENDSNPDNKQVNPAQAFIEKTLDKIQDGTTSMYTDRDAEALQDIIDKYSVNGEIDSDKLYKSFSAEEKRILKGLRDINDSMTEKAEFTAAVIRGNRINPINNYISLSTISDDTGNDQFSSIVDIRKMFDSTRQSSTKAKNLIERTGRVSAINFDPFSSVRKSSSAVLMDYNMTPTIRESRIALKQLEKDVKDGVLDKSKREFVNALRDSFDLIVDNSIGNSMMQGTTEDAVIAELAKQGYRTMLASVERSMGELISNAAFVTFVAPVTWAKGTAYSKFLMSSDFFNLLNNVGSTQTSRIKPGNTLSNRMVDTSILQQASGLKGSSLNSEVRNRAEQIYNLTGKKVKNVAELTADVLISTPDKIMMQPLWMGTFASEFKKEAGVEVDVNKLAANDEAYMDKYADAIEKARREADDITVRAGSTDNAALAVLRNTITPEQKASRFWKWYKTFNGFMSKFLLFEYMTARSAVYQLVKEGRISKKEAVAELAAVTARMTMYSVVISMLGESVIDMAAGLLGYRDDEDDEEEKKKTLAQEAGQGLASTFTTMMFGRNFGNVARAPINMGVEYINQNYLDFLRNGEYDPYTDQLQYTISPKEGSKDPFMDIALNTVGPISPFLKTGRFVGKYMYAPEGKTEDKKERQGKEKWRVALEIPGSLGFVPFYNNIRKVQQDWIYGDLGKAEKITAENIGSKIKSAKSAMTRDINEAIKEQSKGEISGTELNDRIVQAQQEYIQKINDYQKRLR